MYKITFLMESEWDAVVNLMDDETRERVHEELAPCTMREFLARYLELDPEFWEVLEQEFGFDRYYDADLPGVPEVTEYEDLDTDAAEEVAARIRDADYWDTDDVEALCRLARVEAALEEEETTGEMCARGAARILGVELF